MGAKSKFILLPSKGTCNFPVYGINPAEPNEADNCGAKAVLLAVWRYGSRYTSSMNLCWRHAKYIVKRERKINNA